MKTLGILLIIIYLLDSFFMIVGIQEMLYKETYFSRPTKLNNEEYEIFQKKFITLLNKELWFISSLIYKLYSVFNHISETVIKKMVLFK